MLLTPLSEYDVIMKCLTKGEKTMTHMISEACIACGACMPVCPVEAISEGEVYVIDAEKCTDCTACVDQCPVEAISLAELINFYNVCNDRS